MRFTRRMTARTIDEHHRTATPLELLFDLTFVVAISQIAGQLAHGIEDRHTLGALGPYLIVFFAIWWAWMNFTWFASAYDNDDAVYRLLVMLQIVGVLVIAAGVPSGFADGDYRAVTYGYLIMRVGLVALWIRAAIQDPKHRRTTLRYTLGISVVQAGWVARLVLPEEWAVASIVLLAVLDMAVPLWAVRAGELTWHPHHIAERFGLLVLILLGESVYAATAGVQDSLESRGLSNALIVVAISGLVIVFSLWWLYFLIPAGEGLSRRRQFSYVWGYGHYLIFASLAAIGAGLEVAVVETGGEVKVANWIVVAAVTTPLAIFMALLWTVNLPLRTHIVFRPFVILPGAAAVFCLPYLVGPVDPSTVILFAAALCVGVVLFTITLKKEAPAISSQSK